MRRVRVSLDIARQQTAGLLPNPLLRAMSGVAIAGIPESIWDTVRGRTGGWEVKLIVPIATGPRSEGHQGVVTRVSSMTGRMAEWYGGGAGGRVDQRGLSALSQGRVEHRDQVTSQEALAIRFHCTSRVSEATVSNR